MIAWQLPFLPSHRNNHFTVTNLLDLFNQVTPYCIVDLSKKLVYVNWFLSSNMIALQLSVLPFHYSYIPRSHIFQTLIYNLMSQSNF